MRSYTCINCFFFQITFLLNLEDTSFLNNDVDFFDVSKLMYPVFTTMKNGIGNNGGTVNSKVDPENRLCLMSAPSAESLFSTCLVVIAVY